MYGAIFGDYVGSIYEFNNIKTKDFPIVSKGCTLTDDSYMTIAVASACLKWLEHHDITRFTEDVQNEMRRIGRLYSGDYGERFSMWLHFDDPVPYNSYGNGSAMRVSACGWVARTLDEAEQLAAASAAPTHNHPEGIKGAKAISGAIWLARAGKSKAMIKSYVEDMYGPLSFTIDEIRPTYTFNETCQKTVPQAVQAFLESSDYEDAIRNAISLGGDSDTLAAIAGSVAEAFHGLPDGLRDWIDQYALKTLQATEKQIVDTFRKSVIETEEAHPFELGPSADSSSSEADVSHVSLFRKLLSLGKRDRKNDISTTPSELEIRQEPENKRKKYLKAVLQETSKEETFTEALLRLIKERNLTESEVYNSVFMDRRLFNKIRNDREYQPSKRSAILLALALKLSLADALDFLEKAGFVLSHSNRFDVIIKFHIAIGCYDVLEINEALHENNLPLLLKCD